MKMFLTRRERACISLRIPDSGTPWLDSLIAKAQFRDTSLTLMASMSLVMWQELSVNPDRMSNTIDQVGKDYGTASDMARMSAAALLKDLDKHK